MVHVGADGYSDIVTEVNEPAREPSSPPGDPSTGDAPGTTRPKEVLRDARARASVVIALAALAGLIVWIVVDSGGSSGSPSTSKPASISDVALTEAGLKTVVSALGTPVYWVGAAKGVKYELIQLPSGISVRYLPAGVEPSDKRPFLTVATFPVKDAFKVTTRPNAGAELLGLPGSGVGVVNKGHATTVYIAYPGVDYQIALYNPSPLAARLLATSGRVRAIASTGAAQSGGPVAASPVKLRGLSGSLGHPIYWVGNWRGFTYELTETADGRVLIRYLPKGVQVGTKRPELTVATYPMENAFAVTKRGATGSGVSLIHLKDGGIAVYSTQRPESLYVAFPGVDAQIEIFAPSAGLARKLAENGKVAALDLG